jgi:hypothetical protein
VLVGLGEFERALEQLEIADRTRDVHLVFLPVDHKWDAIRSDARFRRLVRRAVEKDLP